MDKSQLGDFPVSVQPTEMQMRYTKSAASLLGIFFAAGMVIARASALAASLMSRLLASTR